MRKKIKSFFYSYRQVWDATYTISTFRWVPKNWFVEAISWVFVLAAGYLALWWFFNYLVS